MKKSRFPKAMNVIVSQEDFDKVKEITDRENTSYCEWLREAIKEKLDKEKQGEGGFFMTIENWEKFGPALLGEEKWKKYGPGILGEDLDEEDIEEREEDV